MRNAKSVVCAVAALALSQAPAQSQRLPNLTGEWKADLAKSDFGSSPAPQKLTLKINHQEPALHIVSDQIGPDSDTHAEYKCKTDGSECTTMVGEREVKSTLRWNAGVLHSKAEWTSGDSKTTLASQWSLSEDGKTLKMTRRLSGARGEISQTFVFEKQ